MGSTQVSSYFKRIKDHYKSNELNPVIGHQIKIQINAQQIQERQGAIYSLRRDNYGSQVITPLWPVIDLPDVYYGEYHNETIGVHYNPEYNKIIVVLFKGHRIKCHKAKSRRVEQFLKTQRTTAI